MHSYVYTQAMEKVTNSDIPSSLAEKLDSLMLQRAEEARRIVQEKSFGLDICKF